MLIPSKTPTQLLQHNETETTSAVLLTVENDNLYYLDNFDVVTLFNTTIKLV